NISPAEGTQVVNGFQDQALVMRFCLLLRGFFHWKLAEGSWLDFVNPVDLQSIINLFKVRVNSGYQNSDAHFDRRSGSNGED
ncbi:MAG TPA: hypothetical protein VGD99_19970, partial [Anaerolineae bacterium]